MRVKRIICMVLACIVIAGTISVSAGAAEVKIIAPENTTDNLINPLATGSFSMSIPAKSQSLANSSFPLAAGETVTIKASYSPFSASVDFGLVAPDGTFYYFNITNGSIDKTNITDTGTIASDSVSHTFINEDWKSWEDSSGHAYASYCADLPDSSGLILDASINFWVGGDSCYITVNDELAKG